MLVLGVGVVLAQASLGDGRVQMVMATIKNDPEINNPTLSPKHDLEFGVDRAALESS